MNLACTYLGMALPHPFMTGASPLTDDLDMVRRLEDAGAAAIVLRSLFEEQITRERLGEVRHMHVYAASHASTIAYFPFPEDFRFDTDAYLEHLRRVKGAVHVPVIASLNGTTAEGWLKYARLIEQAGADALELNIYHLATDLRESGGEVERRVLDIVSVARESVRIPLAVKLLPFFSSIAHLAWQIDQLGANGLVLFNRFFQPDMNPEMLEVEPRVQLSDSRELLLRLRWIAILAGRIRASLALSGGVHAGVDAVKALMAGADAIQLVSALLVNGPAYLKHVLNDTIRWMDEHEYASLADMRSAMSLAHCGDPGAFERGNYLRMLQSWRDPDPPVRKE